MSIQVYLFIFILIFVIVSIVSFKMTYKVRKKELYEKIKMDVTKEQMMDSEKRINQFLETNNLQKGASIVKIAEILNVEQGGVEVGLQNQACLKECAYNGKKVVTFKAGLSEQEKRFVFAHEIAHLLNGDTVPVTRPNGRNKAQVEQLADYTAAALLMPLDEVYDYLIESNYMDSSARKRIVIIHGLCKTYNVTEVIALRRVKEVYVLKQFK